jgi:NAD(P)-dependent dehydrogenase (short-subunit alcohol dehydrogenase family)
MTVAGKTIVVTGASSGIGLESARHLRAAGAHIIAVDRNEPPAGVAQRFVRADLSDPASIRGAAAEVGDGIDGLCNIAGLPPTRGRLTVLRVNFLGLRQLTEALLPALKPGASIVNLASLAGIGWPQALPAVRALLALRDVEGLGALCDAHGVDDARSYFLSKEALIVWTMQNRWTWRERGIRMNSISPGPVQTPILPDFLRTLGARAEEDMRVMDRPGTPQDIAPLVTFLCSEGSAWIRGTNLPCDGGMASHVVLGMAGLG